MPRHPDFQKIFNRFVATYGKKKGEELYFAWVKKKSLDDTKPFPGKNKERKEFLCRVRGVEIKEDDAGDFHVWGLIATDHIDDVDKEEGVEIPDIIIKPTLESWAEQINTNFESRIMGVHHSEGRPFNAEYYGEADVDNSPAKVIPLSDGHNGLFVDTKLLKNDPETPNIIERFNNGDLNAFSVTYETDGFMTTDFDWMDDRLVRRLNPETKLFGYTAASNPKNSNAVAMGFGFKEFKELVKHQQPKEEVQMKKEQKEDEVPNKDDVPPKEETPPKEPEKPAEDSPDDDSSEEAAEDEAEKKEFLKWKQSKKKKEEKAFLEDQSQKIAEKVVEKMEMKEKVLNNGSDSPGDKETPREVKEFREILVGEKTFEIKEQFRRAAAASDAIGLDWRESVTPPVEAREFKNFGVNGRFLEFKGLGVTTNQNTDTDYLQSTAELQDVYDPVIYNALNQETVTWNLLAKDDKSSQGNNQCQFTLKTAANTTAAFYTGNAVSTGNVTRQKYQTKFKKLQVGVSVDGDMIAAARGGPVSDVFAQEVLDSTMDMLEVLNGALFDEVGAETAAAVIGFEYIADSAGNTTLYNVTRSAANKLAPDAAGDTYISGSSAIVSMANLRSLKRQAVNEGANKRNLVFITNPVQGDLLRGKFDDSRRMLTSRDTDFGFATDLFIDGIPVFEDTDCNTDDWFLVDLETHRAGIWIPPTIERLGKTADSEDAFIKMYVAIYNRAPRRLGMIHTNATS